MTLGPALRSVREERSLTQDQVADASGIGQSTISRLERDELAPSIEDVLRIERALGVKRGHVLLRAGVVDEVQTVEQAIAADPVLTDEGKGFVLTAYRAAVNLFSRTS